MMYTVSITSQGQISIPMPLRRYFNLDKIRKALIYADGDKISIEPVGNLLSLQGALKSQKTISSKGIRRKFEVFLGEKDRK